MEVNYGKMNKKKMNTLEGTSKRRGRLKLITASISSFSTCLKVLRKA
jgi:hypothetical protein